MSSPAAVSTPTAMPSDSNRKYRSLELLCFFFLVFKVFSAEAVSFHGLARFVFVL